MRQGTTITHIFNLPFTTDTVADVQISYEQNNAIKVEKILADCVLNNNTVSCKLTQIETLNFEVGFPVYVQVKVLLKDGNVLASQAIPIQPKIILNRVVLK